MASNAVERIKDSTQLKIVSNYGTVEGKVVRKTKSYGSIYNNATDTNIFDTFSAIIGLQQPTGESCLVVTTDELIDQE